MMGAGKQAASNFCVTHCHRFFLNCSWMEGACKMSSRGLRNGNRKETNSHTLFELAVEDQRS